MTGIAQNTSLGLNEFSSGFVSVNQSSFLTPVDDVVSIFIHQADGQHIAQLVDNGTYVRMYITFGSQHSAHYPSINKTSVLFVSISFIVLMIISLAWLIFYYIQRFRYAHAKERLSVSTRLVLAVSSNKLFCGH
ncbi:hypothetical protein NP493_4030g00002 [Ridgeia piscesae]|uniref:Uncharacterized protein n=1 Tax=Ridgeia piscesae TaxID=27915 RepID=A0AAD9J1W4_RIDPI|nr:hypothetical protein NP493_4030g00002 [Ridgeia piscesae]